MAEKTTTQTSIKPANSITPIATSFAPSTRVRRPADKPAAPRRVAQGDTSGATTTQGMSRKVS
jgi:hypothetical protein